MSDTKFKILLTDLRNSDITAEIPFLFHQAGFAVDVYCPPKSWLLKSRYKKNWHKASEDPKTYARGLGDLVNKEHYDWVVFLDDFSLRAVDDFLDIETAQKILPITDVSMKSLVSSKVALSIFSKKYSILTPEFAVHDGEENSNIRNDAKTVPFPLLLKVDRSGGGKGVFFCADESELQKTYANIPKDERKNLLIQKYIDGDNISSEALYYNGTLIAHTRSCILQNLNSEFSISCVREYRPHEGLIKELEYIGRTLGLNGFCSFTFMYNRNEDAHYLVEADLRTHAWFALSRVAGVDFSKAIQSRISGTPFTSDPHFKEVRHFSRDITRSIQSRNFKNLWDWIRNKDGRWNFIPTHDRQLLLATIGHITRTVLYDIKSLRPFGRMVSALKKKKK